MSIFSSLDFKSNFDLEHIIKNLPKDTKLREKILLETWQNNRPPSFSRFTSSMVNQPITWWVGIFHLAMRCGAFGEKYQAQAEIRSSEVGFILNRLMSHTSWNKAQQIAAFNFKYRKADISGRLTGGFFTGYVTKGGKKNWASKVSKGRRGVGIGIGLGMWATNTTIASYGAILQLYLQGYNSIEDFISAVLTGKPAPHTHVDLNEFEQQELEEIDVLAQLCLHQLELCKIINLDDYRSPVPVNTFCAQKQNKYICAQI